MKKLIILILIVAAGVIIYFQLKPEPSLIEVTEKIIVSQEGTLDINTASSTASYRASISGSAKNISNFLLTNISIEYNIAGNSVSAKIFSLSPGQQVNFSTEQTITKTNNPSYKLNDIKYEKMDLGL